MKLPTPAGCWLIRQSPSVTKDWQAPQPCSFLEARQISVAPLANERLSPEDYFPRMYCCPSCFQHPTVIDFIVSNSEATGVCDFCAAVDQPLISVTSLAGLFEPLLLNYRYLDSDTLHDYEDPIGVGEHLIDLVQEWDIFTDEIFCSGEAADLLEEIANSHWDDDSGEPRFDQHALYTERPSKWHSTMASNWDDFSLRVKRNPGASVPIRRAFDEDAWRFAGVVPIDSVLYRARLGFKQGRSGKKLPWPEMDAPPPEKARAGRANFKGEPVLYCAETEMTAIAEVRPATGFVVSVCLLRPRRELGVLDLVSTHTINPFECEPGELGYWSELWELVYAFGRQLSTPLERSDSFIDYLPSQELASRLQKACFDGIRYPSAMDEGGVNLVFFAPSVCNVLESKLVKIEKTSVQFAEYT